MTAPARTLSNSEVYHRMTGVFFFEDAAPTGLVATGGAQFTDTFTLTAGDVAAMSLTVGDFVRIGSNGNLAIIDKVETIVVEAITVHLPLHRAVAIGDVVTKLTKKDLGATDEAGVTLETTQDEIALEAGTQLNTYLFIPGTIAEQLTWNLRNFEIADLLQSVGIDEASANFSNADGAVIDPNQFVSLGNKGWMTEGLLEDNTPVTSVIMSAKVSAANQTLQQAFGVGTIIPYSIRSTGVRSFLFV